MATKVCVKFYDKELDRYVATRCKKRAAKKKSIMMPHFYLEVRVVRKTVNIIVSVQSSATTLSQSLSQATCRKLQAERLVQRRLVLQQHYIVEFKDYSKFNS